MSILNKSNLHLDLIERNTIQIKEYYDVIEKLNELLHEKEIELNEYDKEYFKNSISDSFFSVSKHSIELTTRKMYINEIKLLIDQYEKQMKLYMSYIPKAVTVSTDII